MSPRKNIIQIGDVLPTKEQTKRLPCDLDLEKFLVTRALVQAESGGGKSYLLRRLAEQCYSFLPPIIIDPEGEFASLREKDDYIICAPSGADAVATPATASLLALKILETGVAAVVDIFEMSPGEQRIFVQRFFDALTNAPKDLWVPRLVILDEIQMFAAEGDKGPVSVAIQNASTRWRKRGFVLVGATQRIANVSKDVTAGLKNKFIGGTSQDIDVARAARELGMRDIHAATDALRRLEPGEFYCYGPALSHDVRKIKVGSVETSHPESGKKRMKAPPPPSKKIKELLASLADLPKEAEVEATTAAELRVVLQHKNARIRELEKGAPVAPPETKVVEKPLTEAQLQRAVKAARKGDLSALQKLAKLLGDSIERAHVLKKNMENQAFELGDYAWHLGMAKTSLDEAVAELQKDVALPVQATAPVHMRSEPVVTVRSVAGDSIDVHADGSTVSGPEQRLLDGIAWLNGIGVEMADQTAVAFLANYSVTSSSFKNPRASLKAKGFIEHRGEYLLLTAAGRAAARAVQGLDSNEAVHRHILDRLPGPERRLLEPLLKCYPNQMTDEALAAAAVYSVTSSSYKNPRARLKSLGMIEHASGELRARDILFPYGKR